MQDIVKTEKIDFVVPWVDSNDPEWIKSYNHYRPEKPIQDTARFRDWGIFRYWFRAVERYAPWVNKVFLITNGKRTISNPAVKFTPLISSVLKGMSP